MTFKHENLICLIINKISRVSLAVSLFYYTRTTNKKKKNNVTKHNVMPSNTLFVFVGSLNNGVLRSQKSSYLSCDCSSYILSLPSLKRRMARLDFFMRLSM